jgi:hypothetical protein
MIVWDGICDVEFLKPPTQTLLIEWLISRNKISEESVLRSAWKPVLMNDIVNQVIASKITRKTVNSNGCSRANVGLEEKRLSPFLHQNCSHL